MSTKSFFTKLALALGSFLVLAPTVSAEFCWRESYGRGVGTIPTRCGPGQENQAGLCYGSCQAGMNGVGPVCWGTCPAGYTDHGVGCTKPGPYGRGAGYPWKFGDALNDSGMMSRCEADHGRGRCEKNGAMAYPKCKPGFHNVGCCTCSPDCPSGFTDTGIACTKPSYGRGAGTIPTSCDGGAQYDAGLCYTGCRGGYSGVGPVCWGQCPAGWVNCGAGCATSSSECAGAITDQVVSVLDVAANIALTVATGGSGTAAKAAVTTSAKSAARRATSGISKAAAKKKMRELADEARQTLTEKQIEIMSSMAAGEDFDPYELDPTGIAMIVKAYNKPLCAGGGRAGNGGGNPAPAPPPTGNFEGQLLRDPSTGGVYFITQGRRRHIPDPATFAALGFDWGRVRDMPGVMSIPDAGRYPTLPGNLIRNPSNGAVYVLTGGVKRHVPDPNTFAAMGLRWESVRDLSPNIFGAIPDGPPMPRR